MKYCRYCGNSCADSDTFCAVCGGKLTSGEENTRSQNENRNETYSNESGPAKGQTFKDKVADAFTNSTDTTAEYAPDDINTNRIFAVLSYLGFLFIVPLIAVPNSKYARFHANQGLVLFIAELISSVLYMIPFVGWIAGAAASVLLTVMSVVGIVNAIQGRAKELPVIGKYKILN